MKIINRGDNIKRYKNNKNVLYYYIDFINY